MNSALQSLLKVVRRTCAQVAPSIAVFICATPLAFAQATYVYTGNQFTTFYSPYTSTDSVFAILQLTDWLAPNQECVDATALSGFRLILFDGINRIDSASITPASGTFHAYVSTDQNGQISGPWLIQEISAAQGVAITSADIPSGNPCAGNTEAEVYDNTQGVPRNVPCLGCVIFPVTPSQSNSPGAWTFPPPLSLGTMVINEIQLGILPDIGTSLLDQLQQIETDISTNDGQACTNLTTLIGHVKAQSGKKLTRAQANFIVTTLQNMQAELSCG